MPISQNQTITMDGRLTLSINRWMQRNLADVFLGNHPIWAMLKKKGNMVTGGLGVQIQEPLFMPAPGGPQAEGIDDPYAELDHSQMTGITSAVYTPAEYAIPLSAPIYDLKLQGSETKKVDYVESVMRVGLKRFFVKLHIHTWAAEGAAGAAGARNRLMSLRVAFNRGTGTGTEEPAALPEQVGTAIGTSPITVVGGIDRNTNGNAYWSTPCVTSATALSLTTVNHAISLATRMSDTPDLLIIGRNGFDKLVTTLQAEGQHNIFEVDEVMKKFSSIRYRGCYITFDDGVPPGTSGGTNTQMFVINTSHLRLNCDTMEPQFELRPDNKRQLKTWIGAWYGQYSSDDLGRVHARYSDLTI